MATITVSDFFKVGGVEGVFVKAEVTASVRGVPTAVKVVSIAKHGVEIGVSDKERANFEDALLAKARRGSAASDDCDHDDFEPEDFNDRYDAQRARWGHD